MACCENLQGQTKREGYFPKSKWYNLFDNTTIDAHDEGKSVTLDLPMGHVGVHMPGGTILPLQVAKKDNQLHCKCQLCWPARLYFLKALRTIPAQLILTKNRRKPRVHSV